MRIAREGERKEEELDAIRLSPHQYVDVDLDKVFVQLLTDTKYGRETQNKPADLKTFGQMVATVFRVLSREKLEAYQYTLATLEELQNRGARLFILSNAQRIFTQAEIELTGCATFMEKIYISSDYRIKKPEPEFLLGLMGENQLNPAETVFVGNDLTSDIAIAQAVGIDGVLLNTFPYSPDEIFAYQEKGWDFTIINDIIELIR